MKQFLFSIILSVFSIIASLAQGQQQVVPGEFPDPSIIEVNGTYYATASSNNWAPLFPLYKSSDLINWTFVNYIFKDAPLWTISDYWAPELFYNNGTFYCYYTARNKKGISCIGVATAKNIENGFIDRGPVLEWGNEAIDAFVYKENDMLYITWKAYGLTPGRSIQLLGCRLTDDGLAIKGDAFEILTADKNSWEDGGTEGQCIVKHNGYLYMLYSGNACCGGYCNYKVGVARAKTMAGPWEKYPGGPILESNDTWKCPGHGTALTTNGKWFYLYHAYPVKGFPYLGRTGILSELHWDEQSGWPYFKAESTNTDIITHNIKDEFEDKKLANWWRYDVAASNFSTSIKSGRLTITEQNKKDKAVGGAALCVVPDDADFTVTTKVVNRNSVLKGLVLYATTANSIGLGVQGSDLVLWKIKDDKFIVLNRITIANYYTEIHFKANVKNANLIQFTYSTDGKNWNAIRDRTSQSETVTGDNLAWWSWGMKTGLYVSADGKSTENIGVFDEFEINYN